MSFWVQKKMNTVKMGEEMSSPLIRLRKLRSETPMESKAKLMGLPMILVLMDNSSLKGQ